MRFLQELFPKKRPAHIDSDIARKLPKLGSQQAATSTLDGINDQWLRETIATERAQKGIDTNQSDFQTLFPGTTRKQIPHCSGI